MKTATLNYWLDVLIGIAFVGSAVSGIVFLLPIGAGNRILGVGLGIWSDVHTWSSLLMIGGVVAHVALHWRWVTAVTRKQLTPARRSVAPRVPAPVHAAPAATPADGALMPAGDAMTRRGFLLVGGTVGLATGLGALGLAARWIGGPAGGTTLAEAAAPGGEAPAVAATGAPTATDVPVEPTPRPTIALEPVTSTGVACRHGIVNDRYPGECRHYVDRDGDGICDLSVPGSGTNTARSR